MRVSPIITTVLIVSSFVLSFIILTQPLGRCDLPPPPRLSGVVIEGAHIVSDGAYFRFWIFNNNSFPINVSVNEADILIVPPKSGVDYDVIAPNISVPYEQVTYKFSVTASGYILPKNVDFPVLVLNSSFIQIFDLILPILVTIAAIVVALTAIVIVRRRRRHEKT
jgi:hypothetical protein